MQINQIKTEIGERTTDAAEIQKNHRDCYEQFYDNKLENLEKIDKFLETYSWSKLNQEEIDNLNRLITRSEIEYVKKKNSPQTKQMASQANSTIQRRTYTDPSQALSKN